MPSSKRPAPSKKPAPKPMPSKRGPVTPNTGGGPGPWKPK